MAWAMHRSSATSEPKRSVVRSRPIEKGVCDGDRGTHKDHQGQYRWSIIFYGRKSGDTMKLKYLKAPFIVEVNSDDHF